MQRAGRQALRGRGGCAGRGVPLLVVAVDRSSRGGGFWVVVVCACVRGVYVLNVVYAVGARILKVL